MNIILERNQFEPEATYGQLIFNENVIAQTKELPTLKYCSLETKTAALPAKVYKLVLRTNPLMGNPNIKIIGNLVPDNAAIRLCVPLVKTNPSITLYKPNAESEFGNDVDFEAWSYLIRILVRCKNDDETVFLIIKETGNKKEPSING